MPEVPRVQAPVWLYARTTPVLARLSESNQWGKPLYAGDYHTETGRKLGVGEVVFVGGDIQRKTDLAIARVVGELAQNGQIVHEPNRHHQVTQYSGGGVF